ncbi:hypothetical protein [Nibricoccus sp. IMCC34717]|uniref:hypothetical protein n=1 Tax=Nibricoccus sp. IMCC34717 TaxID=3034021 RepID=UPI00384B6E15
MNKFSFRSLCSLVGLHVSDPKLKAFGTQDMRRTEYLGFLEYCEQGVSLVFTEGGMLGVKDSSFAKDLFLTGVHFYSAGRDGYNQYEGELPNGIAFGQTRDEVLKKLGPPAESGGGGTSKVLNRSIPHWVKYTQDNNIILHAEFGANEGLELITLYMADPKGRIQLI